MKLHDILDLLREIQPTQRQPPSWIGEIHEESLPDALAWLRDRGVALQTAKLKGDLIQRMDDLATTEGARSTGVPIIGLLAMQAREDLTRTSFKAEYLRDWLEMTNRIQDDQDLLGRAIGWVKLFSAIRQLASDTPSAADVEPALAPQQGEAPPAAEVAATNPASTIIPPLSIDAQPAVNLANSASAPNLAHPSSPAPLSNPSSPRLAAAIPTAVEGVYWGVDFGTARSKVVCRVTSEGNTHSDILQSVFPSTIAFSKNQPYKVKFGHDAEKLSPLDWTVLTSMKLYLIGPSVSEKLSTQKYNVTTDWVVIMFLSYILYKFHHSHTTTTPHLSPLSEMGRVNVSAPLQFPMTVRPGAPTLTDPFAPFPAAKIQYTDWLPKAAVIAKRMAAKLINDDWPSDLDLLINTCRTEIQMAQGTTATCYSKQTSEPSATVGDFSSEELSDGLLLHLDCGAGTTDFGLYRVSKGEIDILREFSKPVAGDAIDRHIMDATRRLFEDHPDVIPKDDSMLQLWARDVKPALLTDRAIDIDPVILWDADDVGSRTLRVEAIEDGLKDFAAKIEESIEKNLLDFIERGDYEGDKIASVRLTGGSAGLPQIQAAVRRAVVNNGWFGTAVEIPQPALLVRPTHYPSLSDDNYRTLCCAVGVARPNVSTRPRRQQSHGSSSAYNPDGDKDS